LAEALEDLAVVREELRDAANTLALIRVGQLDDAAAPPRMTARRREIELRAAELRLALWSEERERLANVVRRHGVRP
jgi:hypothetical protein